MTDSQCGSIGRVAPRSDDDVVDVCDRPSAAPSVAAPVTTPLDERGFVEECGVAPDPELNMPRT